ncbi:hypothetical protein [Mammaliicoccus stepanovicii]|uniref:Lipoprotein n=1 Tax=Mammaliicoccus stepanovicii TaxID=643214 RepID=A0A239YFG8_9STAP|nr:hypothetical protein [Mammaliicoccus stepanovicii]PNZ75862.1 hypothetical protein CD111_06460 [Mammaliicoccus stepanovicii]GGI42775.1 hypothetical protein GCM10010896_20100 [Mammaliicoccus stepanovicii]SNV57460.1 Uncharacterised protein [Mammaliicoccus stepanovicii]
MKKVYGLLAICLLFLVACDYQTSKSTGSETNKDSSESKISKKKTTETTTEERKSTNNKNNKQSQDNSNETSKGETSEEIPVEENVNSVKPNKNYDPNEIDPRTYTIARNCLLNQGNSQTECNEVENTIEFTRAWQNLSHDGYLCDDTGCSLPEENQHQTQDNTTKETPHNNTQSNSNEISTEENTIENQNNKREPQQNNNQNQPSKNEQYNDKAQQNINKEAS